MKITLNTLTEWMEGNRVLSGFEEENVLPFHCRFFVDSRSVEPGGIFVCFKGDHVDGHDYVQKAIEKGAQGVISERIEVICQPGVFQIHVHSTKDALKRFAGNILSHVHPRIIGITGSAGKTTSKELMHLVFQASFRTFGTLKNYNTPIGVPLSLGQMPENTQYFVAELSASCPGEIGETLSFLALDHAVITCIGASHLQFFEGVEGVYKEKIKIAQNIAHNHHVWMNGDQIWANQAAMEGYNVKTFGFGEQNDIVAHNLSFDALGTSFKVTMDKKNLGSCYIRGLGDHLVMDALPAIAIGLEEGLTIENIRESIASYAPGKGRGNILRLRNNLVVIDESYNANPMSMQASLGVLAKMPFSRKILILGDMYELGAQSWEWHGRLGKMIEESRISFNHLIYVGEFGEALKESFPYLKKVMECALDWKQALEQLKMHDLEDTVLFVKASNGVLLHRLIEELEIQFS